MFVESTHRDSKRKGAEVLVLFIFLVFLIISETPIEAVPSIYIPVKRIVLTCVVCCTLLAMAFTKVNERFDISLLMMLLVRMIYYIIVSLRINIARPAFFAHYFIVSIGPILFFAISVLVEKNQRLLLNRLLAISIIIIAMQTHSTVFLLLMKGHGLYQVKLSIDIPVGLSNTIASIALIQSLLAYKLLNNKLFFAISTSTLLCTLSKAAFLAYGLLMLMILLHDAARDNRLSVFLKYALLAIAVFVIANRLFSEYFTVYVDAVDKLLSKEIGSLNNGRFDIYAGYIQDIVRRPFFGWGLGTYNVNDSMAHNWLLQSLFAGGLTGTIIYFVPLVKLLVQSKQWPVVERDSFNILLLAALVHGSVENVFFTVPCEFLIWLYLTLIAKAGDENG